MRELLLDSTAEPNAESAPELAESAKRPHPTDPRRWADGTQRPNVDGIARKHPAMRTDRAAVQQWLREKAESIIGDRGGHDGLSTLQIDSAGELAFVLFVLSQWRDHFIEKGLTSPRGRVRSAFPSYLATLDRYIRLAQMLGIDRKAKQAPSPAEWLESLGEEDTASE
jgi:hypothetical protein